MIEPKKNYLYSNLDEIGHYEIDPFHICQRFMVFQNGAKEAATEESEAVEIARGDTCEIHLLMTDVVMPEVSGKDLANKIILLRPDIKTLFMSGYTANSIAHHGILDKDLHFIQKPFTTNNLARKVREVLDIK